VAGLECPPRSRRPSKGEHRLGDVVAVVGGDPAGELLAPCLRRMGADEDPVATDRWRVSQRARRGGEHMVRSFSFQPRCVGTLLGSTMSCASEYLMICGTKSR